MGFKNWLFVLLILISPSAYAYNSAYNPSTGRFDFVGVASSSDISVPCASGKILKSSGSGTWACSDESGGSGTPGGSDTQVQFNDGGSAFGGAAGILYDKTSMHSSLGTSAFITSGAMVNINPNDITGATSETQSFYSVYGNVTLGSGATVNSWAWNNFDAPIFSGVAGGSPETVTKAYTMYIEGIPDVGGTPATLTNGYGLYIGPKGDSTNIGIAYGLYVADQRFSGVKHYNLYSEGLTENNVIEGTLLIGNGESDTGSITGAQYPVLLKVGSSDSSGSNTEHINIDSVGANINLSADTANQRINQFLAPTLSKFGATARNVSNAATVYIDQAPIQGTGMTITNDYAFWVDDGTARFDGTITTALTGSRCVQTDANGNLTVAAAACGTSSGSTTPTGTGFVHINASSQDTVARAVNIASSDITGTLPIGNGGTGLTTVSNDSLLVGNNAGTGFDQPALPSCSNSTTSKLLYNSTTNSFSCGTDQNTDTSPTGTGFYHINNGSADAASRAVNLASSDVTGTLPIGNGGTGLTTVSNDSIFVGNNAGNGLDQPSLPNCADSSGQHLNYTASTGNFSCGTTGTHAAVTLAGENYLTLSTQQITANAINLSGTNVTSTLGIGNGGTGKTSVSDDSLFVGNSGGTLDQPALPSCSNSTTSKLLYNNSTNSFSCGTDQTAASTSNPPPKDYYWPASATMPLETSNDSVSVINKVAGLNIDELTVDFDSATDECRTVTFNVPASLDTNGVATMRADWKVTAQATTGNVIWDLRTNAGSANGASTDTALTIVPSAASAINAVRGKITQTTWTQSLSTLGWAANDVVQAEFCRDADNGGDTVSQDAQAVGFLISIPRVNA